MKRTVKEFLWGYQDPILNILKTLPAQLVTDDQVSVFASVVIFNRLCLTYLRMFSSRLMKLNMKQY
jgi:hypothetical protein